MQVLKFILLGVTIHISFILSAQTNKGSFLIGGDAFFTSSTTTVQGSETKQTQIGINPTVGYFIINNLVLGTSLPISFSKSKNPQNQFDSKSSSMTVGPLIRYYVPVGKLAIFTEVTYAFGLIKIEGPTFDPFTGSIVFTTNNGKNKKLSFGLGATYFVNESIGIEAGLFYTNRNIEYKNSERYMTPNYEREDFNLRIGIQFYLAKN